MCWKLDWAKNHWWVISGLAFIDDTLINEMDYKTIKTKTPQKANQIVHGTAKLSDKENKDK